MYDFFQRRSDLLKNAFRAEPRRSGLANLLIAFLLLGILFGGVLGAYLPGRALQGLPFFAAAGSLPSAFWPALRRSGLYFCLLLASASSYLGLLVSSALVLLRGCTLGCAVAAMFSESGYAGLRHAFFMCGVSALLTLPVMMLFAYDSALCSGELLQLRLGRRSFARERSRLLPHLLLAALLLGLDALYIGCILPRFGF